MDKKEYTWSVDDENYHGIFDTFEEALEKAKIHNQDKEYIFIGELVETEYENWKIDAIPIIEEMQQSAYAEHESAENWLDDLSKKQINELTNKINEVIENWLIKHKLQFNFNDVKNIKKYELVNGK